MELNELISGQILRLHALLDTREKSHVTQSNYLIHYL